MKKISLLVLFLGILLPAGVFAQQSDFQKRLSCRVTEKSVRVYLVQEEGTLKCKEYLSVLNGYLKTEYHTILQILKNLNRGDDKDYRKELYHQKKDQFLKLFAQRKMIQTAMQDFETELLNKSKLFLQIGLLEKQQALEAAISQTFSRLEEEPYDVHLHRALVELKQKQEVIDQLLIADTMDLFMKNFSLYLNLFPVEIV